MDQVHTALSSTFDGKNDGYFPKGRQHASAQVWILYREDCKPLMPIKWMLARTLLFQQCQRYFIVLAAK
jgi:hypothetical protein